MIVRREVVGLAVLLLGTCLSGCGGSGTEDRGAARAAAEAAELQELKEGVSAEQMEKISTVDGGEEQLPDHIVLRRLQQQKAKQQAAAQKNGR